MRSRRGHRFGRDVLDERAGKRRVAPRAVERDVARLRREADQRADPGFDRGQTVPDLGRARAHGAREVARQRIVAAGVEEEDVGLAPRAPSSRCTRSSRTISKSSAAARRQLGIDRARGSSDAADLQPVPGVEEHAHVGARERGCELADLAVERRPCRGRRLRSPEAERPAAPPLCRPRRSSGWPARRRAR